MTVGFGRSSLAICIDGALSGPVKVSYFNPRTGEPCETRPEPLHSADEYEMLRRRAVSGKGARPVMVDGERYGSIQAAARSMRIPSSSLGNALRRGAREYAGHDIRFA